MKKRITRREFIKKSSIALLGMGIAGFVISNMLTLPSSPPKEKSLSLWKWSKEAYHYIRLGNNVQCLLCPNQCILEHGERGRCRVRINNNGKLYTLVYGNPTAVHVDPIEKKPLFHFLPSTKAFSIATAGCNFRCLNCQNWQISQFPPEKTENYDMMPKVVVNNAITESCSSIAYTYNEPSVFYEYMYDTAKLAKEHKLRNLWITNGYMNEKPLRELCKYLDAANVDLKSFSEKIYNELNAGRLEPVLNTLKVLKSEGVWFEITNLVVPTYTDDIDMIRDMVEWIAKNLGKDYPLHFSRFFPHYKLTHLPPTPIDFLEQARKIAMDAGLKFVYIGNVPNHKAQNTYCPRCGRLLVERRGYYVASMNIENNACKFCGEHIAGVWS